MAGISHVLVLSIGNPGAYLNTLHSAGHVALEALRRELMLPPFAQSRLFGSPSAPTTTTIASGDWPRYTLMQSPTLMNVSGPWVAKAWRGALKAQGDDETSRAVGRIGLLVIHDDLEEALGVLKVRPWTRSHRGHNGLKSIGTKLRPAEFKGAQWARLSVGIGRPDERDKMSVSDYVLRQMSIEERTALDDLGPDLLTTLRKIEAQWAAGEAVGTGTAKQPKPPKPPRTRPNARQP
jgi:peptidyl-tRNA hydrolase, PTH1 family